jgi:hypothetical protein
VTNALHILEGEGLVRSTRVNIEMRDRQRLEAFAGSFYGDAESLRRDPVANGALRRNTEGTFPSPHG